MTLAQAGGAPTSTQDNPSSRIADIRPEDIENIEILKGASAAAVYGSRAAAGGSSSLRQKRAGKAGRRLLFRRTCAPLRPQAAGLRKFTAATPPVCPATAPRAQCWHRNSRPPNPRGTPTIMRKDLWQYRLCEEQRAECQRRHREVRGLFFVCRQRTRAVSKKIRATITRVSG